MKVHLTFAAGDYDIVRPLATGEVEVDGVELTVLTTLGSRERHLRMARNMEFDLCEFNIAAYHVARDQGFPYTALPVFLHRRFRHGFVFVNPEIGTVKEPRDLIGKRVGGTNFMPAGNVWIRGILEEHHGVPHREITWVTEREEDIPFDAPADLVIECSAAGRDLDQMLVAGELDAIISPSFPRPFLAGDPRIARLFPDNKAEEIAYYRKTGIFPIMHCTTIRREIVEKHPWVPGNLMIAFNRAKALAYRRIANPRMVPVAWIRNTLEEQEAVLGRDPWAYGLGPSNRAALETIARYCHQQGMTRRPFEVDELYVAVDDEAITPDSSI